jgi:mannose-6-phosphate isomerase-like protein (cupin superfamily)
MINKKNAPHYTWGADCDSWVFADKANLSVKLESMPAEAREKLHYHSIAEQFFFILKGTGTFYIEGKVVNVVENEGISIAPNSRHFIANEAEGTLEFLVVSQPSTNTDRIEVKE